jgi:hypothetical protein
MLADERRDEILAALVAAAIVRQRVAPASLSQSHHVAVIVLATRSFERRNTFGRASDAIALWNDEWLQPNSRMRPRLAVTDRATAGTLSVCPSALARS